MYREQVVDQHVPRLGFNILNAERARIGINIRHVKTFASGKRKFTCKNVRLEELFPKMGAGNIAHATASAANRIERNPEDAPCCAVQMKIGQILVERDTIDGSGFLDEDLVVKKPDDGDIEKRRGDSRKFAAEREGRKRRYAPPGAGVQQEMAPRLSGKLLIDKARKMGLGDRTCESGQIVLRRCFMIPCRGGAPKRVGRRRHIVAVGA